MHHLSVLEMNEFPGTMLLEFFKNLLDNQNHADIAIKALETGRDVS